MRQLSRRRILQSSVMSGLSAAFLSSAPAILRAQTAKPRFGEAHINIVNTSATTTSTLQKLLSEQGFLDEFGLDATNTNIADGGKLMGSLLSGENDICMLAGIAQLLPALEKGAQMKVIAGANTRPTFAVYAKPPEIKSLADLVGRTVATGSPGALLHHVMVAALLKAGVDYNAVKFVNVGSSADAFRALAAGVVDAAPSSFEFYNDQARWGVHSISELWDYLPEYPFQGSFASDTAIREKRDVIVRTLAAYAKAYRFLMTPESKAPYLAAYQSFTNGGASQGEDQWGFNIRNKGLATDLVLPEASVQFLQDLNVQLGVQKTVLPFSSIADMSMAKEAVALLG